MKRTPGIYFLAGVRALTLENKTPTLHLERNYK